MRKNNFSFEVFLRPLIMLVPLIFGAPFLSYCLCSFNAVMTVAAAGPVIGGITVVYTALISALLGVLAGYSSAYCGFFALQIMLTASVCAFCIVRRKSFYTGMLLCSIAYGVPMVMSIRQEAAKMGLSIADYVGSVFNQISEMPNMPELNGIDMEAAQRALEIVVKYLKMSIPSMIAICAAFGGYAVMWLVSSALRSTPLNNGHSFSNMKLGKDAIVFGIVMLALMFVPWERVSYVALNGLIVFLFMSFCCGMSLTEFMLKTKIQSFFLRALIHGLILSVGLIAGSIIPFVNPVFLYIIIGIMDGFISIRKKVCADYEEK